MSKLTGSKGPSIAAGRTAEVFSWNEDRVLKLYLAAYPAATVDYEARIAAAAHTAGLPVPAVEDVWMVFTIGSPSPIIEGYVV